MARVIPGAKDVICGECSAEEEVLCKDDGAEGCQPVTDKCYEDARVLREYAQSKDRRETYRV